MTLTLQGRINSFEEGIYRCLIYPTGPVILATDIIDDLEGYRYRNPEYRWKPRRSRVLPFGG